MSRDVDDEEGSGSMAEAAYRRIEAMIVTRKLPPGTMISENQLREDLGCGRTPIREALQRLRLEGFIEIHPRRGALVTPVDVMKQLELLEVRGPLELVMTGLAVERATGAERAEMRRLAEEMVTIAASTDKAGYLEVNRAVHEIRMLGAHNGMLMNTMRVILALSRRFWYAYIEDTGSFSEAAALHSAILHAIADGRAEASAAATRAFIGFLDGLTQRAIARRL